MTQKSRHTGLILLALAITTELFGCCTRILYPSSVRSHWEESMVAAIDLFRVAYKRFRRDAAEIEQFNQIAHVRHLPALSRVDVTVLADGSAMVRYEVARSSSHECRGYTQQLETPAELFPPEVIDDFRR